MNNETNTNNNAEQPVITNNQVNNNPDNTSNNVPVNNTVTTTNSVNTNVNSTGVVPSTTSSTGVSNSTNVVPNNQVNMVQSNSVINPNATNQVNPNGGGEVVPENLKSVEIDYKPPSKFKIFVLVVFFVALIAFVLFLPEITEFVNKYKSKENEEVKIVDGKLLCSLESTTVNLTNNHDVTISFKDNKAESLRMVTDVKGSTTEDAKELDKLNEECKILEEHTKGMEGVSVSCEYSERLFEKKQSFELASVNFEELDSVYSEAGGTVPEYRYGDDMDEVEKSFKAAGYSCVRER